MTNNIIGFLGSQSGMNEFQKQEVLKCFDKYMPQIVHHGGYKGADEDFHDLFISWCHNLINEQKIIIHPSLDVQKWMPNIAAIMQDEDNQFIEVMPPLSYMLCHEELIRASDIIIACPKEPEHVLYSATWKCIRYAWKQKKKTIIIPPLFAEPHE